MELNWIAIYNDKTLLPQRKEDGTENAYKDIDRSKLIGFALVTAEGTNVLTLHLDPDRKLIFRRRCKRTTGSDAVEVVYMVGWKQNVNGTSVQSISYVTPDGTIHMAGRFKEDHPWFYGVEFTESEVKDGMA